MANTRTCRGCKIDFLPRRKKQEYHNRKCYLGATIRLLTCPECGINFPKKFHGQVCCSPECGNSYRAKKNTKGKTLACSFDGKPVYKMLSKIRKHNFCDDACKIAWLRSDKNPYKKRRHTSEEKQKISQANLNRDYSQIFTKKTRQKLRVNARKTILRPDVMEKTRSINSSRLSGSTLSEETKQKIKAYAKYGSDNIMWKEKPSNVAIHLWANRHLPHPKICVKYDPTGKDPCSEQIEASSKGNQHIRDITTWEPRCTRHHDEYEYINKLVHPKGKIKNIYAKYGNTFNASFTVDAIIIDPNETVGEKHQLTE